MREILSLIGQEDAKKILYTDFKAFHNLQNTVIDRSGLSPADVINWHFTKIDEYGFGGWWIWQYRDSEPENEKMGIRTQEGKWKPGILEVIRKRTDRAPY